MLVEASTRGDPTQRLVAIAHTTRARRHSWARCVGNPVGPAFRVLARLGMFSWFVRRQRLVTTFVTTCVAHHHR